MSLPGRQQRALDTIESSLQTADPQLNSMFSTFTRLTRADAMPVTEVLYQKLPQRVLACVMALAVASAILVGTLLGGQDCRRAPVRSGVMPTASMACRNAKAPVTSTSSP
jgi:hypothetical protein